MKKNSTTLKVHLNKSKGEKIHPKYTKSKATIISEMSVIIDRANKILKTHNSKSISYNL